MSQLKQLIAGLSLARRLLILAAVAAAGAALWGLVRWRQEAGLRPLYAGLSAEDAGAVVARLRESGVAFRVTADGGTVLVPEDKVAELRLALAAEGLPRSGRIGFELFDRGNFGTTEFAEQVNYRRALEGELERSVRCLAEVEQARVHLTFPKDSLFEENRRPAKASVLVRLKPGAELEPASVQAITYLVASAVDGLAPEAVSVLDMRGRLLNRPRTALGEEQLSEGMLAYRQSVERDLVNKINATLEPLVGPGKFRAAVSAECDFSSGEQSEETFDPARSVMLASQKTEEMTGTGATAGVPGTASNLPRPTATPSRAAGGVSRRTEAISYQSSRVVRRVKLPQGTIKRLSVAVLLDHATVWQGEGRDRRRVLVPLPPERVQAIRQIVAASIGLVPDRGDQLIVESLPFEVRPFDELEAPGSAPSRPPAGAPAWAGRLRALPWYYPAGGAGGLLLLAGLWWLLRKRKRGRVAVTAQAALPPAEAPSQLPEGGPPARPQAPPLELPEAPTKPADKLAHQLREMVKRDPAATAQVLQTWLTEAQS
ncbi:MAG: flagellar basal-body MS-ring/collar protein FliF [Bryobacterales bacterium]|nr:flagellar basal-body MS-ring/collar protein FliF [Bryobacteraceae bacterium]MDW8354484.1 flagellar basal-body MS-ring/collar protein FliF [Bryobacterales bacterium]